MVFADGYFNAVLHKTLDSSFNPADYEPYLPASENHWHLRTQDRGGSLYCPQAFIVPLTDNLTTLQTANSFDVVELHSATGWGQTYLHLGIVWGLRTLSPLWRDVWKTRSVSGDDLPRNAVP